MDRAALSLMVDPVRQDLGISEVHIGLLIGFAFVLLYSTAGVPLGRMADRGNRRNLIIGGLVVWSIATAACGIAGGFVSLAIARLLVGLGEATLSPAAYSLIASTFPRHRIGIACAIFALGMNIGTGFAGALVAFVSNLVDGRDFLTLPSGTGGWRATFLVLGLLSIPVLLLLLGVREPRQVAAKAGESQTAPPGWREVFAHLRENWRAYGPLFLGCALMTVSSLGAMLWGPAYFARVHEFSPAQVGSLFLVSFAVVAPIGSIVGGLASDRLFRRGHADAAPRVILTVQLMVLLPALAAFLGGGAIAPYAFGLLAFLLGTAGGIQVSMVALMAPVRLRGLATAFYLMVVNIIGMGLGPLIVAVVTERVLGDPAMVGVSLAIVITICSTAAALLIASALPGYRRLVPIYRIGE